jgi:hypothetical protein
VTDLSGTAVTAAPLRSNSYRRLVAHLIAEEGGVKNLFESRVFFEAALARWAALNVRKGKHPGSRTKIAL